MQQVAEKPMTHWKKSFNPDFLGAWSLDPKQELVLTIAETRDEEITGTGGKKEVVLLAYFKEDVKPMILNATNCKAISRAYKTSYREDWVGKKIQVYATHIKAFGEDNVEALRIRPFAPKVKKKTVSDKDFPRLIKSVKEGKMTLAKAKDLLALTPDQIKQLEEIK